MPTAPGAASSHGNLDTVAASVLVADDDEGVTGSLRRLLESAGYRVTVATDGSSAVEAARTTDFDVILSDIEMPRMSGIQLLEAVRSRDVDVPVILMTGAPTLETAIDAVALGALSYLQKPADNVLLLKTLERASRLRRLAQMKRHALELLGGEGPSANGGASLRASFERALDTMWMAFQPIVDARQGHIYGFEALMRAKETALPHPGAVLEAAENLGRLPDLGRHVRRLAAAAFAQAPEDVLLFVNLHTRDLLDEALFEQSAPLSQIADRVVLEITERSTIDGVKDILDRVYKLRQLGFRIAIDDLGAGYAGLSTLAALEPEIVKLDMSLIRNVHRSDIRKRLVISMTNLCREMGMLVVAEGVEVVDECEVVTDAGCDLVQGYLFARPGPPFPRVETIASHQSRA